MPEENQESNETSQQSQQPEGQTANNEAPYLSFLERILTPIFSMRVNNSESDNQSSNSQTSDNQTSDNQTSGESEEIAALKAQLEELKSQISTQTSGESEESGESVAPDNNADENNQPVNSFPQPASAGGKTKTARDEYLELVQQNPRRAALYFQENHQEIMKNAQFFE